MDPNIEEAVRAKENAEKLFLMKDFAGAKQFALRAQTLCPQLEGISQMVATFEIYAATTTNMNREVDFYSVLGLDPFAEKSILKKRYKKMAVLLHPDKNKTVGADEAFKLVSEAWAVLSDNVKRSSYDAKRNKHLSAAGYNTVSGSETSSRLDTFWTVCTSCRVQYEYLRKYVNKRLSCKNCRGVFVAVETGAAPVTYAPWSYTSENGYANHGAYNTGPYVPSTSVCFTGNGSSVMHPTQQGYEYAGTVSFQWNTCCGSSTLDPNGLPAKSANMSRQKSNGRHQVRLNPAPGETLAPRMGRPPKKRKIENGETGLRTEPCSDLNNGNGGIDVLARHYTVAPAFDARKLLIDKARSVIRGKLKEMKMASAIKAEKSGKMVKKSSSMAITVPDPDFHDFDTNRSEEVFKPKQIWAIYDEEDGMPRLYCLIRQVISVKPFQLHITYLNSKPDTEFGFNKSCGSFKVSHSVFVDQVNIFSHLLGRENAGKGGCVNIYPKRGDVWAVYRNWSEGRNKKSKKGRKQYEMVEILDDYSEKVGVCVTPLTKLEGYKTVYQRNPNKNAVRLITRKEMVRFSHQVPACLLKGQGLNLPDGCWDLDPAATPEQLLQADADAEEEEKKVEGDGHFGHLSV